MKPATFRARRGQSTTEFALMLPLIFAILFGAIEYAYYLGAIHYTNYGTFVAARAIQGSDDPNEAADMVLTGNATSTRNGDTRLTPIISDEGKIIGVGGELLWGSASTPGFNQVLTSNMDVRMEVFLGPEECGYEGRSGRASARWSDNQLGC